MSGRRAIAAGTGSGWDDHRNTSRLQLPPPNALPDALRALERLRLEQPALVAWVEDGAPRLTEAEHVERFGEPHAGRRGRRG